MFGIIAPKGTAAVSPGLSNPFLKCQAHDVGVEASRQAATRPDFVVAEHAFC